MIFRGTLFGGVLLGLMVSACGDISPGFPAGDTPALSEPDSTSGVAPARFDGGTADASDLADSNSSDARPLIQDTGPPPGDQDTPEMPVDARVADAAQPPAVCPPPGLECDGIPPHDQNAPHRFPIVLVHGMGGFENIGPLEYYFGIPELLRDNGYHVAVTITDPFNSSEIRAAQLAPQIDRILACSCKEKVNLIAHSQGGIDARLLISGMGYSDRVASLTTISTPHRGTPVADVSLGLTRGPGQAIIDMFLNLFSGVVYGPPDEDPNVQAAMRSCSTPVMAAFNDEYPNADDVAYFSYAGFSGLLANGRPECDGAELPIPRRGDVIAPEFSVSFAFLGGSLVANDGLVPVESARWGRFRGCIPADHLDEIGQIGGLVDRFDYRRFYLELAEFIGDEGL